VKPLKVAILTSDKRDHDRDYANPAPGFGAAPAALLQGFAQLPEVEIHVVSCTQQPMRAPEKIAENIWYHALHVPKTGWMRTLYQGCIRATRKKLREIRPDIVHGQGTERDCAISAVLSGFPNVLTIHGNMRSVAEFYRAWPGSFYWLAARLEGFALRRTAGVFCNSAYTESLVRPSAPKTWRVPNALRPAFFVPPSQTTRGVRPVLLNVGAVSPHKQQAEILAVARKLWQRGLRFEMQFAGTVDQRTGYDAGFMRQIAGAERAGYARHLGMLQTNELVAAMDAASALVHFPLEEAFGLVVAEALARNLKLFASSAGGVPDIATGIESAELLPMNGWIALENSIARWLEAGCPRPSGVAEVMRRRYHPGVIARRHLEIYREISGSSSSV
jgi:glycosyltransferase involved in cell wall biosynthesis